MASVASSEYGCLDRHVSRLSCYSWCFVECTGILNPPSPSALDQNGARFVFFALRYQESPFPIPLPRLHYAPTFFFCFSGTGRSCSGTNAGRDPHSRQEGHDHLAASEGTAVDSALFEYLFTAAASFAQSHAFFQVESLFLPICPLVPLYPMSYARCFLLVSRHWDVTTSCVFGTCAVLP